EPVPHHVPRPDGRRLADKDEEGGLEGVLRIVVVEEPAAHAPHHRAVPPEESSGGRLVATLEETAHQLAVARRAPDARHLLAQVFDQAGRHVPPSAGVPAHPLPIICRTMPICYTSSRRRS